ncbi:hypothetical protein ACC719_11320 [Rhizobium ruizarguesonis]
MTIDEILHDPLVGLMLHADKVCAMAFAEFLETAARELAVASTRRPDPACDVKPRAAELPIEDFPAASLDG